MNITDANIANTFIFASIPLLHTVIAHAFFFKIEVLGRAQTSLAEADLDHHLNLISSYIPQDPKFSVE